MGKIPKTKDQLTKALAQLPPCGGYSKDCPRCQLKSAFSKQASERGKAHGKKLELYIIGLLVDILASTEGRTQRLAHRALRLSNRYFSKKW